MEEVLAIFRKIWIQRKQELKKLKGNNMKKKMWKKEMADLKN